MVWVFLLKQRGHDVIFSLARVGPYLTHVRHRREQSPANRAKLLLTRRRVPRNSDQARSMDGWHFSGDAVRFLQDPGEAGRIGT
jgi:hypothetical protein